jgi:hypothetical protein
MVPIGCFYEDIFSSFAGRYFFAVELILFNAMKLNRRAIHELYTDRLDSLTLLIPKMFFFSCSVFTIAKNTSQIRLYKERILFSL